ncbi:DgyrCDS10073 [Dimorphilus gyrociliatus]|uniref:tRNA (guanine(9)-N(1))-methyltransferase n=1 Tax=Dimorphilus gyrociliatus TaxID=2664684 RepID=A0A7I8W093_9ANNE|nr:DgyrCDS10073 [Dimorphilus gyrociliatus]
MEETANKDYEPEKIDEKAGKQDESDNADKIEPTLSKKQQKKLAKYEKRMAFRSEKRQQEKLRKKERRKECLEKGLEVPPSRKSLKKRKMKESSCQIRVVMDCGFNDLMNEKDIGCLSKQIQNSYAVNRRAPSPLQLHICNASGELLNQLQIKGSDNWDIVFLDKPYYEEFDKKSIVYLSSDSENVLNTLEVDKVYIIGGLVDHNHSKGLCLKLAEERGISHAQLPIGKYIQMCQRKVLAVNHVFDILLKFSEQNDWKEAFETVLPKRKKV